METGNRTPNVLLLNFCGFLVQSYILGFTQDINKAKKASKGYNLEVGL